MATFPSINFAQYQWVVNDTDYLNKWNAMQVALGTLQANIDTFGTATEQEQAATLQTAEDTRQQAIIDTNAIKTATEGIRDATDSIKTDVQTIRDTQVYPARDAAQQAATESEAARDSAVEIVAGNVRINELQPPFWELVYMDQTLVANTYYKIETDVALNLTLPSAPTKNDWIRMYVNAGNPIGTKFIPSDQEIMALMEPLEIDYKILKIDLIFNGGDWRVVV